MPCFEEKKAFPCFPDVTSLKASSERAGRAVDGSSQLGCYSADPAEPRHLMQPEAIRRTTSVQKNRMSFGKSLSLSGKSLKAKAGISWKFRMISFLGVGGITPNPRPPKKPSIAAAKSNGKARMISMTVFFLRKQLEQKHQPRRA